MRGCPEKTRTKRGYSIELTNNFLEFTYRKCALVAYRLFVGGHYQAGYSQRMGAQADGKAGLCLYHKGRAYWRTFAAVFLWSDPHSVGCAQGGGI